MGRFVYILLFLLMLPCTGFALSRRDHDNRYYVTDEMWKQHPYNKFVRLRRYSGSIDLGGCTAQYVSHNLILSAGHCVVDKAARYKIENYKKYTIPVELIYNACGNKKVCVDGGNYLKGNDWAIWRIKKRKHFNDDFFNVAIPKTNIQVINAGFGSLRILNDNEIKELKQMLKDMNAQSAYDGDIYDKLSAAMVRKGMKGLGWDNEKLKASTCNLVGSASSYSKTLDADCYGWGGNSGGAVVSESGKILYGIRVAGDYTFDNQMSLVTSPRQFQQTLRDLIVQNGGTAASMDGDVDFDNDNASEDQDLTDTDIPGSSDIAEIVSNYETDVTNLENQVHAGLADVSNMDNAAVLNLLNNTVELKMKKEKLEELQKAYEEAKTREQSFENRALTALTVAATGIGGMELAQGLSEQRIDRESEQDMAAYIETFRCEYANGKSVKNGATNVELPSDTLFDLYQEYITLAADLKERKEQLGLAPGIESEVIIDKATAGLYDDKASEKANGTFASIYRAKMGNETDQAKLQEMSDTSGKRVKGGAIAAGAGSVIGVVGNVLINGKTDKNTEQ